VRRDLENVAAAGLNTVRTYCLPTPDLLDAADELNLRLLVGLHYDDWRMLDGTSAATSRQVLSAGRRSVDEALERLTGRQLCAGCRGRQRGARRPGAAARTTSG
jgi:hypothetical protein